MSELTFDARAEQLVAENVRDYWDRANAEFPGKQMLIQAITIAFRTVEQATEQRERVHCGNCTYMAERIREAEQTTERRVIDMVRLMQRENHYVDEDGYIVDQLRHATGGTP